MVSGPLELPANHGILRQRQLPRGHQRGQPAWDAGRDRAHLRRAHQEHLVGPLLVRRPEELQDGGGAVRAAVLRLPAAGLSGAAHLPPRRAPRGPEQDQKEALH